MRGKEGWRRTCRCPGWLSGQCFQFLWAVGWFDAWLVPGQSEHAAAHVYLLPPPSSVFCKTKAKQTHRLKHAHRNAPQIAAGVWAAPPHPEPRGFSSNTPSRAVSCSTHSLLAKGAFCTALPFFPCDFYELVPLFPHIVWFWSDDFLFRLCSLRVGYYIQVEAAYKGNDF